MKKVMVIILAIVLMPFTLTLMTYMWSEDLADDIIHRKERKIRNSKGLNGIK